MSFFTSLGILILAMLIQGFLQLTPTVFAYFYHFASGKSSRVKADNLSLYFILGTETFTALMYVIIYALFLQIFVFLPNFSSSIFPWILAGIMLALAIVSFLFYFRKGAGTRLYIPRRLAENILKRAESVKSRSDAFILGLFSGVLELVFILPLLIVSTVALTFPDTTFVPRCVFVILYTVAAILPLFIVRAYYRSGHNFADFERSRVRSKSFTRLIISISFALIAFALILSGVLK